jgi:hypothetical protein
MREVEARITGEIRRVGNTQSEDMKTVFERLDAVLRALIERDPYALRNARQCCN